MAVRRAEAPDRAGDEPVEALWRDDTRVDEGGAALHRGEQHRDHAFAIAGFEHAACLAS